MAQGPKNKGCKTEKICEHPFKFQESEVISIEKR